MKIESVDYKAFRNSAWGLFKQKGWFLAGTFVLWMVLDAVFGIIRDMFLPLLTSTDSSFLQEGFNFASGTNLSAVAGFIGAYGVLTLVSMVLSSILQFGYSHMIAKYTQGKEVAASDLFYAFKNGGHWIKFVLFNILATLIFITIMMISAAIIFTFLLLLENLGLDGSIAVLISVLLGLASIGAILTVSFRFAFAGLAVIVDQMGPVQAMKYSFALTKDNTSKILAISLQGFGWTILGFLALGVGLIVAIPFVSILIMKYYFAFRDHHEASVKHENNEQEAVVA